MDLIYQFVGHLNYGFVFLRENLVWISVAALVMSYLTPKGTNAHRSE